MGIHSERRTVAGWRRLVIGLLAERDGWLCQICGDPIDPTLTYPDRKGPSVDHVVPLSKGGTNVVENVQLTHLTCNITKSDTVFLAAATD